MTLFKPTRIRARTHSRLRKYKDTVTTVRVESCVWKRFLRAARNQRTSAAQLLRDLIACEIKQSKKRK